MIASKNSIPLGEVAELNPRLDEALKPNDQVSFVPMAAVTEVTGEIVREELRPYAEVAKGFTPFKPDDVIVAKITPCFQNGKIAHAQLSKQWGFGSTEFHVIRANVDRLFPRYAFHFLRQNYIRVAGERRMTGSAGQRRVPKNYLAQLQIPLPPLSEQKRIAEILDRAEALRAKRRAALALLEELTQSIFLDMFGDPVSNPMGWSIKSLEEAGVKTKTGPFGSLLHKSDYIQGGVPLVNPKHMNAGAIEHGGDETVAESKAKKLFEYRVQTGDLLMARRGEMGRCAIVHEAHDGWLCGTGSFFIRPPTNTYLAEFLESTLSSQPMRKHLENLSGGAIMPSLSGTQIKSLRLPLPPIALQRKFVATINAIKQHFEQQQRHNAELDQLFASLQHRAFRGEL